MKTRTQRLVFLSLALLGFTSQRATADEPTAPVTSPTATAPVAVPSEPASPRSTSEERSKRRKLTFAQPAAADIAAKEKQTREGALRTFALISSLEEFQCRMSEECLSRPFAQGVGIDLAFQDVVLGVPVYGQARLDGTVKIDLAPDADHMSYDVIFAGTVALKGTGRTQDVQIHTDTLVDFSAMKRIRVDHDGVTSAPATCTAKAAITTKGINSSRPLLGKFSERIAQRKTASSKEEAEAECAEHLQEAISEHLDREVTAVTNVVNAALAAHLKTATADAKARWTAIHFNTAEDFVDVARASAGKKLPEFKGATPGKPISPLVLQLPRARLDVNVVLTGMRYLQKDGQQPAASSHVAVRQPVKFRPVVELGSDVITFRFEFDEPAKLVQDAAAPKAPLMP